MNYHDYIPYIPHALGGLISALLIAVVYLLAKKRKVEIIEKGDEEAVNVSISAVLDDSMSQIRSIMRDQRKDMDYFVREVVSLQDRPVKVNMAPKVEKQTDPGVPFEMKKCPFYEAPCLRGNCISFWKDGNILRCAAQDDIILERLK